MKGLQRERNRRGFTLVELLVVVTIIGILAAVVFRNIIRHPDRARQKAAKMQIVELKSALEEFYINTGTYPTGDEGLKALVERPLDVSVTAWEGPYLPKIPKDPWGREYVYRYPGASNADFDLICYGKDGVEGGEGVNQDITNHNLDEI